MYTARIIPSQGKYIIELTAPNKNPLYLRSVKNGMMKLYLDYSYSTKYSLKTAQKHANAINNGLYERK